MEELKERDQKLNQNFGNHAETGKSSLESHADVEMIVQNQEEPAITENLVTENTNATTTGEVKGEEVHHENWIPPEKRRPEDEFFDLKSILVVRETDILGDGSITKLVIQEGKGAFVDMDDVVYYLHETRFDNGQLVDLQEMRKVP
jgi:hypothetical protein